MRILTKYPKQTDVEHPSDVIENVRKEVEHVYEVIMYVDAFVINSEQFELLKQSLYDNADYQVKVFERYNQSELFDLYNRMEVILKELPNPETVYSAYEQLKKSIENKNDKLTINILIRIRSMFPDPEILLQWDQDYESIPDYGETPFPDREPFQVVPDNLHQPPQPPPPSQPIVPAPIEPEHGPPTRASLERDLKNIQERIKYFNGLLDEKDLQLSRSTKNPEFEKRLFEINAILHDREANANLSKEERQSLVDEKNDISDRLLHDREYLRQEIDDITKRLDEFLSIEEEITRALKEEGLVPEHSIDIQFGHIPPVMPPSSSSMPPSSSDEELSATDWYNKFVKETGTNSGKDIYETAEKYVRNTYSASSKLPTGLVQMMNDLMRKIKLDIVRSRKVSISAPKGSDKWDYYGWIDFIDTDATMSDNEVLTELNKEELKYGVPPIGLTTAIEYLSLPSLETKRQFRIAHPPKARDHGGKGILTNPSILTNQSKKRSKGRPRGSGILHPFKDKVDTSRGIDPIRRYIKFGKYLINTNKLNDDVISIKRPSGNNIIEFPSQRVSTHLSSVFKKIIGGGIPSFNELNKLNEDERNYLHRVATKSEIADKLSIPSPSKDQKDKDIHEYEVAKGEILSGNDNKDLIKRFKLMVVKLCKSGILPKKEANEILSDLVELGY